MNIFKDLFETKEPCYATGFVSPKTTSLFFDKIWLTDEEAERQNVPHSLRLFLEDDEINKNRLDNIATRHNMPVTIFPEKLKSKHIYNIAIRANRSIPYKDNIQYMPEPSGKVSERSARLAYESRLHVGPDKYGFFTSFNRNEALRVISNRCQNRGINLVPVFIEQTDFEKSLLMRGPSNPLNYKDGFLKEILKESIPIRHADAIAATVKAIPVVVEDGLSWNQVKEIRRDRKSVRALRRFRTWALTELEGKSQSEITDILGRELDDYEYALTKHGVLTTIGGFTTILSAASTIAGAIEGSQMQLAAAGLSISAGAITFSAQQLYEYFDTRRHPIAYIYNITEK